MRRTLLEYFAAISLTLAAIIAPSSDVSAGSVMIMKAYARASATPTAKTSAAYVSLMNHAPEADRLLAVTTPAAASAEVHKTESVDGVMKMMPAGALEVPGSGMLEVKPGGFHPTLGGPNQPPQKGGENRLPPPPRKAGEMKVKVPVGAVAAGGMDHDMNHMEGSDGASGN